MGCYHCLDTEYNLKCTEDCKVKKTLSYQCAKLADAIHNLVIEIKSTIFAKGC